MLKFIRNFFMLILLCSSIFFSWEIFTKLYFNNSLIKLPDLSGLDYEKTEEYFDEYNISFKIMGRGLSDYSKGTIYSQMPKSGHKVKKGRTIRVWVSKGKNNITVPDFSGMDLTSARNLAEKKGLKLKNISYAHHQLGYNSIIASDPVKKSVVKKGSDIYFLVSLKKDQKVVYMPDIIGLNINSAKKLIKDNNLVIGNIDYIYDYMFKKNLVLDAEPKPGTKLIPGTIIDLIVNKK